MDVEHIAVIGAGTMGSGIAQVFLQSGFTVTVIDQNKDQIETARETIESGLDRLVEKEVISEEDTTQALKSLHTTTEMNGVTDTDLILEAVPEVLDIKAAVFSEAAEHNADAIYASNTSSIPITKLAEHVSDSANCIGMHFFNPAPVMDIVEVVTTADTSEETQETVMQMVDQIGKEASVVQDVPGFVSNRILMPFLNEAIKTLEAQIASKEDIDKIAKHGFNHPMGPLELADFIGLDVCLDIMERMYEDTGEERFKPADLLRKKVEAEELGKKSGDGFYTYE